MIVVTIAFLILFLFISLTDSSSPLSNSFFNSNKNSSASPNSNSLNSKSSNKFSFQTLANPLYTYNSTHWICSSTVAPLILILKYNLHTVINPPTLLASPLNIGGLTISILDPAPPPPTSLFSAIMIFSAIMTYKAIICFCCTLICFKSWLTLS